MTVECRTCRRLTYGGQGSLPLRGPSGPLFPAAFAARLPGTLCRHTALRGKESHDAQDPSRDHGGCDHVDPGRLPVAARRRRQRERRREHRRKRPRPSSRLCSRTSRSNPHTIAVPADTPVSMTVMNHGEAPHTFGVDVDGSHDRDSDHRPRCRRPRWICRRSPQGSYEALCTVPGHADLGMVATVIASAERRHGTTDITAEPAHARACRPSRWPRCTSKG